MQQTWKTEITRILIAALLGGVVAFLSQLLQGLAGLPLEAVTEPAVGSTTAAAYIRAFAAAR